MSLVQQVCTVAWQVEVVAARVEVLGDSGGWCGTKQTGQILAGWGAAMNWVSDGM